MNAGTVPGWDRLRHGGLLLDTQRLAETAAFAPTPLPPHYENELRNRASALLNGGDDIPGFVSFVLLKVCGFSLATGSWKRGPELGSQWGRRAVTGETVKPRQLWQGHKGGQLPVFIDSEKRLGVGRGRRATSQVLQWLRSGDEQLAVVTNGRQWRLIFAGLDFDAWCEWDLDLWFEEGELSPQVTALRTLLQPALWTPTEEGNPPPLLQAILDSRKGQAELSQVLGERVREAVELLVQGHGESLKERCADVDPADIYRAAVRIVMRLVVVLFAESRELLPRDNALYHAGYGLSGLLEELEKTGARSGGRLARSWSAWPRVLALFRLVYEGSHHPSLPVPGYGGELFAPGHPDASDGLSRALAVFETASFAHEVLSDRDVRQILDRVTRTKVKVRQGLSSTWTPAPVDFSDLSSEYIGILYEGLLDFELKVAPAGDPVIFLAVGNQPALPLSRLEAMDDKALKNLLEKMKDSSKKDEAADEEDEPEQQAAEDEEVDTADDEQASTQEDAAGDDDERHTTRSRAESWARRAVAVGKLVRKPSGGMTPEKRLRYEETVSRKARQLVTRVILPGEHYLVRWGGTRKGSGTFYTRPGLAVPTVQRTLRPLAWDPPATSTGEPDREAPPSKWTPKAPEEILALKVVDPGCGSGTFPVAALRYLTDSLYASLHHHERISADGDRSLVALLTRQGGERVSEERLCEELLPCRPEDETFEPRLKAILRRHVVERCIYGVDLDPLAVELCRLALWVETMDRTLPFSFLDHKIKCGNALVGAWFDQFQHYPVMAWKNREGGDKGHSNGVHYAKEERTKAIKAFVKDRLTADLTNSIAKHALVGVPPDEVHDDALTVLAELHDLPVVDARERARIYRERFLGSRRWQQLKAAFDQWCACWFWPAECLDIAPLNSSFSEPSADTVRMTEILRQAIRFFHWELEFPDVFDGERGGFDAMLGNPPWEIAKPNSKEYFSNFDPLYRTYGKQEALHKQSELFADEDIERSWLDYNANFRGQSNFFKFTAKPFGDPDTAETAQDRFSLARGRQNQILHEVWRKARKATQGYADSRHPFAHQGSADVNLYKLFLEKAHALLRNGGRLGFIVPSGLYSDHGTGALRELFLEHCSWEWLFGFENREGIFAIHRSFKFNPVIIEKGGTTEAIRTAFMRRKLEDWERAESYETPYTREQVEQFSPRSKAILEIQSRRDLEILEKIYANSVLLGDQSPDGWGITYSREFDMTNDSKLFPPRPKWEEQGYRPDEYSRWLKGNWRPIGELWHDLGIQVDRPVPIDRSCEEEIKARGSEVQRTDWRIRCAQPPYDALPLPRADFPEGIIFSREGDGWIREENIEDVALPLYEGRMIGQLDFSDKGWVSGKGRGAVWRDIPWDRKQIEPQYLMAIETCRYEGVLGPKLPLMNISSSTNSRTLIAGFSRDLPCNHSLNPVRARDQSTLLGLASLLNSFVLDAQVRVRLGGLNLSFFVLDEVAAIRPTTTTIATLARMAAPLSLGDSWFAPVWIGLGVSSLAKCSSWRCQWGMTGSERFRHLAVADAVVATLAGQDTLDLAWMLQGCDFPTENAGIAARARALSPKGFWRVDKDKDPELRHTVLTQVAFHDLEEEIRGCGGDREKGIEAFLAQNDGEGWLLPETLCLSDYGLGHDERAKQHQPVASRLGPRFYDWQLAQTPEESWRECHLHARNLLGEEGYRQLVEGLDERGDLESQVASEFIPSEDGQFQGRLF